MKILLRYFTLLILFVFSLNVLHAQIEITPNVIKYVEEYLGFKINNLENKKGIKITNISARCKIYSINNSSVYEGFIINRISNSQWKIASPIIDRDDFVKALIAYKQFKKENIIAYTPKNIFYKIDISGLNLEALIKLDSVNVLKHPAVQVQSKEVHPKLSVSNIVFTDENNDARLNANEKAKISFQLENKGSETAPNVEVFLKEKNNVAGLIFEPKQKIGSIPSATTLPIILTVEGSKFLQGDMAFFEITAKSGNDSVSFSKSFITSAESMIALATKPDSIYRGSGDPLKGLNVSKSTEIIPGTITYYALIVGVDKYSEQWIPLNNAVHDAKAVEKMLREKYKVNYFYTLYDAQATRAGILRTFEILVESVKEEDNVLIYFSGHGEFKKSLNKGFWVPVDAKTNSVSDLISNNDIQTFLSSIKSKHTLLISDACFSGDIFRGNTISIPFEESEKYYTKVYNKNSRQALTSGGVEPVMDGGKDGHSVFAYYLLKTLSDNQKKYFDAGQLYDNLKIPVINNSEQTPLLNPVKNTGDEGGQFIFIKK